MISNAEKLRFELICREVISERRESGEGIGQLNEKRLHSIIKRYICPDESGHEIKLDTLVLPKEDKKTGGRRVKYVADVLIEDCIYEVQTGSFYPMRQKIKYYLENTDYNIIVVHPLSAEKWVSWIDETSGDVSKKHRSPKKERAIDIAKELYWLLDYLDDPRLNIYVMLLSVEEYRLLNGWDRSRKRGSERYELIPTELCDIVKLELPEDYALLLPSDVPTEFTVPEYSKLSGLRGRAAYSAVKVLLRLGFVSEIGTRGRAKLYRREDL